MAEINHIKGDATSPQGEGKKIIAHVCNDIGAWGAGFVLAISNRWKTPEQEYRRLSPSKRKLGYVQLVPVENEIVVANMIGQEDIKRNINGVPPVRYEAIKVCLEHVIKFAESTQSTIHMPRIGCGLAGGQWSVMEEIVKAALKDSSIKVYVYEPLAN